MNPIGENNPQPVYDDDEDRRRRMLEELAARQKSRDPADIYMTEQIVHRARLCETDFRQEIRLKIGKAKLFSQTKNTLNLIVDALYDKTIVLAKVKDIEFSQIDFDIALNLARASYNVCDINNPELLIIEEMMAQHFGFYVSRAWGDDRERRLQNKLEQASEITHREAWLPQPLPKKEKRGLFR